MSGVGAYTITPPELKSVRDGDVVKCYLVYERYFRQIAQVNLNRFGTQRIAAAGSKARVSAELLKS